MSPGLKWSPSIHMYSKHEKVKFDRHKKVINSPPGYQNIRVHLIFAVKYDGRHKARLVADGHMTPDFVESIYSGLVIEKFETSHAYLEAVTEEKLYIVAGPEFEDLQGYILTFSKALDT